MVNILIEFFHQETSNNFKYTAIFLLPGLNEQIIFHFLTINDNF